MTDLLNQARSSRGNGQKKMWTMIETLALIVLKGRGQTAKEIAKAVGHSENSCTYRFSRWCGKFDSFAEILSYYEIGDKSVEEIEQMVDEFVTAD